MVGEKDFSEGFLHDIADLIDMCSKEGTDNIELTFEAAGKKLCIEMTFSLKDEDDDFYGRTRFFQGGETSGQADSGRLHRCL